MSIRNSFLAFLATEPAHGYALKSSFEHQTAGLWPLNAGQVYTTLSRLERDGLVTTEEGSDPERRAWRITEAGQQELETWYRTPVDGRSTRDELVIKIMVALASGVRDLERVVQIQRSATMVRLQEATRKKIEAQQRSDLASLLVLDALVLRAEAEIRWLDLCEQRVVQGFPGAAP